MKKLLLTTALIALTTPFIVAQTQVIAHRGFWKTQGSAENSIAALVKADSIGCYGSEFDVWLTKDNQLIVNHDPTINGRFIQHTTAKKLIKHTLKNHEHIPTLAEYLTKGKELKAKLILELKSLNSRERETLAVEKIVEMVKSMGLEDRMEYIAFSLHVTKEFIRLAPKGTPVFYLNGDLSPNELKEIGAAGADYNHSVFKKHPEWISECHALGLKTNVWTVNKENDMQWFIDHKVDFITTNEPTTLQHILLSK